MAYQINPGSRNLSISRIKRRHYLKQDKAINDSLCSFIFDHWNDGKKLRSKDSEFSAFQIMIAAQLYKNKYHLKPLRSLHAYR